MSSTYRVLLRGITMIYLLLFITAFACSGYLLKDLFQLKPVPLTGLLKYLLLCVLFLILAVNAIKALTLKPEHIGKFYRSTTNFKWLFTIAFIICLMAKLGFFHTALQKQAMVTDLQTGILFVLGIFCSWSDTVLVKMNAFEDVSASE
ncbi:hypothetical protein [Pedobacter hartonius]|uniref:Uncharacterized protein n=1 Tax=Pedobacter hartonius TaxID=425514 RepID=A0A1H4GVV7_9SPHI|nr:hypothetical protein [Pedobacter hartonius]SEB13008.1 hypothetical protein SAMN05443550_111121 [Pedobacter hartonius]